MPIEYRNLRKAFLAIYADIVRTWGGKYDHAEAEAMFQHFLDDLCRELSTHWTRQLVS